MLLSFFALSGLSNAITSGALGLYVYLRNPKNKLNKTYGVFCIACSLWGFSYFLWLVSVSEPWALFFARVLMAAAALIPSTNLHYFLRLLGLYNQKKGLLFISYGLGSFFLFATFTPYFIKGVSKISIFSYWPEPGWLFHPFLAFFAISVVHLFYLLFHAYYHAIGVRRNQLKYLLIAMIVGYGGGATNFPQWYGFSTLPYGNIGGSIYIILVSYAIVRYRLMDINIVIKKSMMYAFLLLGLLIPCYLLVILGQKIAFGTIHYSFSIMTLVFLIVVGFSFPKIQEALERALFKGHHDYRETLLRSSRDMISIVDLETLSNNLLHTVEKALGIDKASLFLLDDVKGSFDLKANIGFQPERSNASALLWDDPLIQKLVTTREPLVQEEIEMARDSPGQKWIADRMALLEAEVSLPLVSKERLIGVLNMGHKQGRDMYSDEDLEVLTTLANQAAIAIENARLYENLKRSQDIIRRADRLSSLGMLTAGLAHEIRNPLVAIRTFTQLLPERYADVEFRNNFQTIALKEVDRICGLVNDLLSFARPTTPNVSAEDVNQIVESTARMLETQAKENDTKIQLNLERGIPNILIDKEQIKQVLVNFVLNAIQAIEDRGVVELSTRSFVKDGSQQFVQIGVRDSGVGIAVKDLENIFNPFFTTKEGGSGLGLSISHQIVQDHGGSVVVESKVDEGSTFLINLPVSRPLRY